MSNQPSIVFLDSGKGGLPYLMHYRQHDQSRPLIYVADNALFPYGMKDKNELCHELHNTIKKIITHINPALIVLACNTASVTALKWLRQRVSIPLVGVVPAVKPASAQTTGGRIGLLVTERTATGDYLHDLIGQFASDHEVVTVVASDMVKYIEDHATSLSVPSSPAINVLIRDVLSEFAASNIDTIVLGCTHFLYVADLLQAQIKHPMAVIDSRSGVTNRIRQLAKPLPTQSVHSKTHPPTCYMTTDSSPSFEKLLTNCNIHYAGTL